MHIGLITMAFGIITAYSAWRSIQLRKGKPPWPIDNYLGIVVVVALVVGCTLAVLKR